jgi:hypothetical protein
MHANRSANFIPSDIINLAVFGEEFFSTLTMKIKRREANL